MSASRFSRTSGTARLVLVGWLLLSALLAGCGDATDTAASGGSDQGSAQTGDLPSAEPDTQTLAFTATTVSGEPFDGESLQGKPAVLWFWAPWCPTCRGQIPMIGNLNKEYGDRVNFVGVGGLDDSTEAIAQFAGDVGGMTHLSDPEGTVWQHFGITAQSTFVVIDGNGAIVADGALDEAKLTGLVRDLAG